MKDSEERFGRSEGIIDRRVLKNAKGLIVGCGSMGSVVVPQLWREGAFQDGRLRLIDGDTFSWRNMNCGIGFLTRAHIGLPKAEVLKEHLLACLPEEEESRVREEDTVQTFNRMLTINDATSIRKLASDCDLVCLFADEFDLMLAIAKAVSDICPVVISSFAPKCDFAEVVFAIPNVTAPVSRSIGKRKREGIKSPRALGFDTAFVANYVASLCCRILLGEAKGSELCVPLHADGPLHIIGLRHTWVFKDLPDSKPRITIVVNVPP